MLGYVPKNVSKRKLVPSSERAGVEAYLKRVYYTSGGQLSEVDDGQQPQKSGKKFPGDRPFSRGK